MILQKKQAHMSQVHLDIILVAEGHNKPWRTLSLKFDLLVSKLLFILISIFCLFMLGADFGAWDQLFGHRVNMLAQGPFWGENMSRKT